MIKNRRTRREVNFLKSEVRRLVGQGLTYQEISDVLKLGGKQHAYYYLKGRGTKVKPK